MNRLLRLLALLALVWAPVAQAAEVDTITVLDSASVTREVPTILSLEAFVDGLEALVGTTNTDIGPPGATVCATDTGSCSVNALLQRIAQRLTSAIAGTAVTIATLPALAAGTANIGDVDVLTLPALVAGTANIGDVDVLTLPALVAGTANIGDVDVLTLPALSAGSAAIGKLAANSGVDIGDVDVTSSALPTGAATSAKQDTTNTNVGAPGATTCATDTGSCDLNAKLSRIAERVTSLIASIGGTAATAAAVPATAAYLGAGSDGGLSAGTAALTGLITCRDSVVISTASSGNVELVALTASETIYVCGYTIVATGTVAVQLIYGTGTACATGETNLTGAMPLVANSGLVDGSPYFRGMKGLVSNAFCIELSAAIQIDGVLYYTKF